MSRPSELRELTVKPRRRGYRHRDIIAVIDGIGLTEHGEPVQNLPLFASSSASHLWITIDPANLLNKMRDRFEHLPSFNYQLTATAEDVPDDVPTMTTTRLVRFGFTNGRKNRPPKGIRREGQHVVWTPQDMMRNPLSVMDGNRHGDLLKFATDVREWCKEQDIPLPTSLAGIAASLLRDSRFYPEARGRVPRATNERVRPYLPGVYSELRAPTLHRRQAVALDQRRAYHRAAQEIPLPDPTTLFARGYFNDPENSPVWAKPGDPVYERTMAEPGLVCLSATSRRTLKDETRPPAIDFVGNRRVYLWTNEVQECVDRGLLIWGMTAAWTSTKPDTGMPIYGKWAQAEIDAGSEYRRRWLKPTLHSTYGLLAARTRRLRIGYRVGRGEQQVYLLGAGHEIPVREVSSRAHAPATMNTAMLGTLQAEIRLRSLKMANALMAEGVDVLHVHADGLHIAGTIPLMADDGAWTMDTLTKLVYLDRVSWMSEEGDCLPGRDQRARAELLRHHANLIRASTEAAADVLS